MSSTTNTGSVSRPRSPWTGSQHQVQHRWQLDGVGSLAEVMRMLTDLAAELTVAHRAGWWLVEPMRAGHLVAARASRRQRGRRDPLTGLASRAMPHQPEPHRDPPWRLRLVDEPPSPGLEVFDATAAAATPVLAQTRDSLTHVSGPALSREVLSAVVRQVTPTGLSPGLWGVAPARIGPNVDLVAHGSALRLHAVRDGALVRTCEALTFQHAADGAVDLLQAAASYEQLARTAGRMAAAGGLLVSADDGLLQVAYGPAVPSQLQKPIGSPA
jgi:hypothetical protein